MFDFRKNLVFSDNMQNEIKGEFAGGGGCRGQGTTGGQQGVLTTHNG
jgi:hypothetical protein